MNTIETIAIIPAYNEVRTIGGVIHAAMQANSVDGVVVVDDGSSDATYEVAQSSINYFIEQGNAKPLEVVSHPENRGKTDTLRTGVNCARELGGVSLSTLVFLDADSSPIWSRDTQDNMKLWQSGLFRLLGQDSNRIDEKILEGRRAAFSNLLARYVDEIVQPVSSKEEVMRTGMYQRNVVTDTVLTALDRQKKGGHAGNRAIPLTVWDGLEDECEARGVSITGWDIEAALNEYLSDQPTGTFMMYGVVNVGSRVKAGGFWRGVARMAKIHGQMPFTKRKLTR